VLIEGRKTEMCLRVSEEMASQLDDIVVVPRIATRSRIS
jgi:hypothetical protein